MKFYIADAFTDHLFGGNPAGIVVLDDGGDFPDDVTCVKVAAEFRYSETVFIKKLGTNDGFNDCFHFRYFTPTEEVDLCGHATIAAFSVLSKTKSIKNEGDFNIRTGAGDLAVNVKNSFVIMEMSPPEHLRTLSDESEIHELYKIMGVPDENVIVDVGCGQYVRLLPSIISTGLPDIILPMVSLERLNRIQPDFNALSELSKKYNVTGVHAFTVEKQSSEQGVRAHTRNFAPLVGINEEAATGTSNGALTYYLYLNEVIGDNMESLFIQGEAMDRPSKIFTHIKKTKDGNMNIQVGGTGVILAAGEIFI